jgi:RNA polymerase sigma-70 factor (ECF subfamily)
MTEVDHPPQPPAEQDRVIDERDLLRAIAAGDREAASELVDRTYSSVYAALFRFTGGDEELAADLTQETYRKAWTALSRFDGRSRFGTWLYRIGYTTFLNHVRRPRRLIPMEPNHERAAVDPAATSDSLLERSQEATRLRRAVLELPEELRLAVTARYWGEVPVREIARLEGITQPAVRKRIKRALKILGHAMEVAS